MTTRRAPFIPRPWTEADEAALRSLVEAGMDARTIGKEINRSIMGVQARMKKLNLTSVGRRSQGNLKAISK